MAETLTLLLFATLAVVGPVGAVCLFVSRRTSRIERAIAELRAAIARNEPPDHGGI